MPDAVVAPPHALRRALADASLAGSLCTWVYLTVQGDRVRSEHWLEDRREKLRTSLWAEGSPEDDVLAIDDALKDPPGAPGRINRYLLARSGRVVLDEVLPGARHGADRQGHGFVADVVPVLQHVSEPLTTQSGRVAHQDGTALLFAEAGVRETVSALRGGRAALVVLDHRGFGEQSLDCLDSAPWVALGGQGTQDRAAVTSAAPTAAALVRAALQAGVEVAFAEAATLPGGAPVAYTAR